VKSGQNPAKSGRRVFCKESNDRIWRKALISSNYRISGQNPAKSGQMIFGWLFHEVI